MVGGPKVVGRRARAACAALLAALTLLVYWPATGHEFISYDDPIYVTKNPHVLAGISAAGLRWSLTATAGGSWHPLTWWSHMLDVQLFGGKPGGHHATSILLHAASSAALLWFLAGISGSLWPSLFAAGLFALHPLHVESVAWVAERKDVLAAFFWMTTLGAYLAYCRQPRRGSYLLVIALFMLALMSKPMAVTLPLVLLLLDYWPLGRLRAPFSVRGVSRLVGEKVPLLLLAAVTGYATIRAQHGIGALETLDDAPQPFRTALFGMRVMNATHSYLVYLGKTIWPVDLAIFYPYPAHALTLRSSVATGLALVLITVLAGLLRRRAPFLTTGWLWYLLTLLPVIGFLQVGAQAYADRYTYLPLIGVFLMISWGSRDLALRRPDLRRLIVMLAAAVLGVSTVATVRQLGYWRDQVSVFLHAAAVTSDNYLAYRNLGEAMRANGDFTSAERYFRKELAISPRSSGAHNRLGMALTGQRRLEDAVAEYREAVRLAPDNYEAQNNLGLHLALLGSLPEALERLQRATRLSPGTAEIHANLGDALVRQGRIDEAVLSYRKALELKPGLTPVRKRLERLVGVKSF